MGILDNILQRKSRTVEEAEAELSRLETAEQDLEQEKQQHEARLEQLQEQYGNEALEAKLSGDSKKVNKLQKEIEEVKTALQNTEKALESSRT